VSATTNGTLFFDLPLGTYTLTYATPFETGSASFHVLPLGSVGLSAVAGPCTNGVISVTATVTNTGFQPGGPRPGAPAVVAGEDAVIGPAVACAEPFGFVQDKPSRSIGRLSLKVVPCAEPRRLS